MRALWGILLIACTSDEKPRIPPIATQTRMTFLPSGDLTLAGPPKAGTAGFDQAPVDDHAGSQGSGTFNIIVGSTDFSRKHVPSVALTADGDGTRYLVLADFWEDGRSGAGEVLYVITPASDWAPGATILLDGHDRIALFAAGSVCTNVASTSAAAIEGTVTFGTGGGLTTTITADVAAAFAPLAVK